MPLPGEDVVTTGIADLRRGAESVEALLVSIAAPRLRQLGYDVRRPIASPEMRLYDRLSGENPDAAHSRYNVLIRRLVRLERAAPFAQPAGADVLQQFVRAFGAAAQHEGCCYLAGGATAVFLGWRESTFGVDISLDREQDEAMRELPRIKQELSLYVELASPGDFIPLPSGWEERSISVAREGRLTFLHLDPYAQTLAKLERAHALDLEDVRQFLARSLIEPDRLRRAFEEIEPQLYRFPAVDPASFRARVDEAARNAP